MKRIMGCIVVLALAAFIAPAIAGASSTANDPAVDAVQEQTPSLAAVQPKDPDATASTESHETTETAQPCTGFVDEDGDGMCDNQEQRPGRQGCCYVDEDGDGVCDNRFTGKNQRER